MMKLVAIGLALAGVAVILVLFVFESFVELLNDIGDTRRARKALRKRPR
jgi:hypothetical protein